MAEQQKPRREMNKSKLGAALMSLVGDLQEMNERGEEVPLEAFEELNADGRFIALMGFCAICVSALQEG